MKSIKKRPFSLPLQTKVYCFSLCTMDTGWFVFSLGWQHFLCLQDSAKLLLLSSRMYFSSLLRKFLFCWIASTMTKTHHLDPATPQNHFLHHVILRHLVIPTYFPFWQKLNRRNGKTSQHFNFLRANGCMNLTNRWCTSRTSDIAFINSLKSFSYFWFQSNF